MSRGNLVTESMKRLAEPLSQSAYVLTTATTSIRTRAQLEALTIPKLFNADGDTNSVTLRGLRLVFFGTAADGTTHEFTLWGGVKLGGQQSGDTQYAMYPLAVITVTMGALVGLDDQGAVKTTERFADTIVSVAPTAYFTFIKDTFGGDDFVSYSPADDTIAMVGCPDGGNMAVYAVDSDAASGTIGCLICRDI